MPKIHFRDPDVDTDSLMGRSICQMFGVQLTEDGSEVTCKLCQRILAKRAVALAAEADEPFVPSGPYPATFGARELGALDKAAIAMSIAGVVERSYRWSSARKALEALVAYREDGQSIGSTSNPARFAKAPRGQSDPMRQVAGQVDKFIGVSAALEGAYAGPTKLSWTECECGAPAPCEGHGSRVVVREVDAAAQRWILVQSHRYRTLPAGNGRLGSVVPFTREYVTRRAGEMLGCPVTEKQVAMIVRVGRDAVRDHLRAIGEMKPAPRRAGRETEMPVKGYDLRGWDQIEAHVGYSVGTLRKLSERKRDPLPVYRTAGVRGVNARCAELDAWMARNEAPASSAAAAS